MKTENIGSVSAKLLIMPLLILLTAFASADLPPLPKPKCPNPSELKINASCRIPFENPLPRMRCGKVKCGTYNNVELSLPGVLTTSDERLGMYDEASISDAVIQAGMKIDSLKKCGICQRCFRIIV